MLDYDLEAPVYDATRGGEERAAAAAGAVEELVADSAPRTLVDVACGTGIVSARLAVPGRAVLGVDRSAGMLAVAAGRLPGRVLRGDATRLPVGDATADAVVFMWLLHLVPEEVAASAIAEAARVLRPGGVLITTVDKAAAAYVTPSDIGDLVAPVYRETVPRAVDSEAAVAEAGDRHGLRWSGESGYVGFGQGRSPRAWAAGLPGHRWVRELTAEAVDGLRRGLLDLPDTDTARPDPVYRVGRLTKE